MRLFRNLLRKYFMVGAYLLAAHMPFVYAENDFHAVENLVQTACVSCHDAETETNLNLNIIDEPHDSPEAFQQWVLIFDRIQRREMPPPDSFVPSDEARHAALSALKKELSQINEQARKQNGRVPSRRLSRREYEHTLHDLLGIGGEITKYLPPEDESGAFDVVAANQEMSSVHVKGFLKAAEAALDEAIELGPKPKIKRELDYANSRYMQMWFERPVRNGGGTVFQDNDDLIMFRGENYNLRSDSNGLRFSAPGRYRITVTGSAYQPRSSVTMSLKRQNDIQGNSELFAAWDVTEKMRTVSTIQYFRTDDYFYVSADELEPAPDGKIIYNSQPASEFEGEGVRVREVLVEGPLETTWPPRRTRSLLPGVKWEPAANGRSYRPITTKSHYQHIRDAVAALAPRAFRRPVTEKEITELTNLAIPSLKAQRGFIDSARIPLAAILISPHTLVLTNDLQKNKSKLTDHALASRLSYFLWRSPPDEELLRLANEGRLSESNTLSAQVDRLLTDQKNKYFIHDFLDQWLELDKIDATTPDTNLYPEYDDVLRRAMLAETREFFSYLLTKNLPIHNLIDSDFTFLNRRLAEHYGIEGILGETMRKISLDKSSPRGGILGHASIAKVTANGSVTTPVKRGNFILTNVLGLPPKPPPPNIGAIEPDTRGATTIRQMLLKHQSVKTCAACHQHIDPPGFAMEGFDPVGTYRLHYRIGKNMKQSLNAGLRLKRVSYNIGPRVNTSGVTVEGDVFQNIRDYRKLLRESTKQIARNTLSQLFIFATGGEIEFSDRDEVERILHATQNDGYPLQSLVHHVVTSPLFRNR